MGNWTDMWDAKFSDRTYAYGKAPNAFLRESLERYPTQGSALFGAEGEGRNAVYAAQQGLDVTAFDISEAGKKKALALASEREVVIDYQVGELSSLPLAEHQYDLLVLIYAHFPPSIRADYHRRLSALVRPGGFVMLEAFTTGHVDYRARNPSVGGPGDEALLITTSELQTAFAEFEILQLQQSAITLDEGEFHRGEGYVVRFVGRRRG